MINIIMVSNIVININKVIVTGCINVEYFSKGKQWVSTNCLAFTIIQMLK